GRLSLIGKAIRQHTPRDTVGPGPQNRRGDVMATARQHETAHRDQRVAAPVGEPGKTGHDRMALPTANDIRLRRAIERRKRAPMCRLLRTDARGDCIGVTIESIACSQYDRRASMTE